MELCGFVYSAYAAGCAGELLWLYPTCAVCCSDNVSRFLMDHALIVSIAEELAKRLPSFSANAIILQCLVVVIAAAVGAFAGEYLRARAKNLATKADFNDLLIQLRHNTELVETIRSEVGQRDWARREWTNLRKTKLEELVRSANKAMDFVSTIEHFAPEGKVHREGDAIAELEMLTSLYFPELAGVARNYANALRERAVHAFTLTSAVLAANQNLQLLEEANAAFVHGRPPLIQQTLATQHALRTAARAIVLSIMPGAED